VHGEYVVRDLTGKLQVGEVADGRRTEWSPAAADRGRRRRPQVGEVVQEVASGCISKKATTISSSLSPRGEPRWRDTDAMEEVFHL
jgi:hypothetical protein